MSEVSEVSEVKVLIADDDALIRSLLADLIEREGSLRLVGAGRDADEAISLARRHDPDVALVDVTMPGGGGQRAAREIIASSPLTRVLALSASGDPEAVMGMIGAGADGYLVKGAPDAEIVESIHRCVRGEASLSGDVATAVVSELFSRLRAQEDEMSELERRTHAIRWALEPGNLATVFQPIFDLGRGRVVGMEALSRFPADPHLTPDVWFAKAASLGLGTELEVAAVRAALSHLAQLPDHAFLSVNASPSTVQSEEFLEAVSAAPAERLVVEITEHAPVADYEALDNALSGLRQDGMRLAIDDAGAGYSSLQHIVRLAPDLIKLDISITRGLDSDRVRRALASALITFATEIDASIVAEGIENAEELNELLSLGVNWGQGYFLARPGPAAAPPPPASAIGWAMYVPART